MLSRIVSFRVSNQVLSQYQASLTMLMRCRGCEWNVVDIDIHFRPASGLEQGEDNCKTCKKKKSSLETFWKENSTFPGLEHFDKLSNLREDPAWSM